MVNGPSREDWLRSAGAFPQAGRDAGRETPFLVARLIGDLAI